MGSSPPYWKIDRSKYHLKIRAFLVYKTYFRYFNAKIIH